MPGGRKPKRGRHNRNISGLRNQPRPSPDVSEHSNHPTPPRSQAPSPEGDDVDESDLEEDDDNLDLLIHFDSLKTQYANESENKGEVADDESEEELHEWEGFEREDLIDVMVDMFEDDDEKDQHWLPAKLAAKRKKRQENKEGMYSPIRSHLAVLITMF
jgi:hypothetical protein